MSFWNLGLGGSGSSIFSLLGNKDGGGQDPSALWDEIINKYSYKPQYTGDTEKGLYNLFNQTNGSQPVGNIPFDIGLPTTGLYDSLTRGIKEQYLGTPGGPEGGRIADTRAYYNNMGIPEYAQNQERLANKDLNNSLLDTAAGINNNQKDRLLNVLGLGANVGQNLYSQDLAQQRFNTGIAAAGAQTDLGLQQTINSANNSALSGLVQPLATAAGTYFGGPVGGYAANQLTNPNAPNSVTQNGSTGFGLNSLFGSGNSNTSKSTVFH